MNEKDIAKKITQALDFGVSRMEEAKLAKLRAARVKAMANYREPINIMGMVTVSGHTFDMSNWARKPLLWLPVLAIAVAAVAYNAMDDDIVDETGALDAQLLTGELPINAFLDQDFQSWVKDSSR